MTRKDVHILILKCYIFLMISCKYLDDTLNLFCKKKLEYFLLSFSRCVQSALTTAKLGLSIHICLCFCMKMKHLSEECVKLQTGNVGVISISLSFEPVEYKNPSPQDIVADVTSGLQCTSFSKYRGILITKSPK